jgi:type II secretory pathway component PulM
MKLDRKQMTYFSFGGLFLVALLFYLIVISPALSKQELLAKNIAKRRQDLVRISEIKARWQTFQKDRSDVQEAIKSRGSFTLLSYLEAVTREIGIDRQIQYIKPVSFPEGEGKLKPEGIEISLDGVNMEQLVNFLYRIEYSGKLLHVKRIKILRASSREKASLLKVTLQVNNYNPI